jgi:outer membrane protein TolC
MKICLVFWSALFLWVFVAFVAHAQEPLTLDEAVRIAEGESPQLDQVRAQSDYSSWKKTEALSGFLPTVSLTGHYYFYERSPVFEASYATFQTGSLPPASPWLDGEFNVRLPIFDGLRNVDQLSSAAKNKRAGDLNVDYGTFTLRQQIRLAFYGVKEAEELAIVAAQDVKDLEDHERLVQDQLRAGIVKRVDLLRVETQLVNAVSEKTNSDDEVQIRRQRLAQLMGEDSELRPLQGAMPKPDDVIMKAIDESKLGARADIEALGLQADAASDTQSSDSKWWVPELAVLAGFDYFRNYNTKINLYAFGVQAKWNLFDGLVSYSRSKESLATERIATRGHEIGELQARTDFETFRRRYRYNLLKYRAQSDDVTRSQESMKLARAGFRAGTQTTTDVLDAEQDLFNARASQIQAQYGALDSQIRFELAIGRKVTP